MNRSTFKYKAPEKYQKKVIYSQKNVEKKEIKTEKTQKQPNSFRDRDCRNKHEGELLMFIESIRFDGVVYSSENICAIGGRVIKHEKTDKETPLKYKIKEIVKAT